MLLFILTVFYTLNGIRADFAVNGVRVQASPGCTFTAGGYTYDFSSMRMTDKGLEGS